MSQLPALDIDDAPFTPPSGPISSKDFEREMAQSPGSSSAFSLRPQRPSPRPSPIVSPAKPPLLSSNAAPSSSSSSAGPPTTPIPFSPVRSASYRGREREKERDKERERERERDRDKDREKEKEKEKDNSEESRVKERRDRRERERKDRKDRQRKPSEDTSGRRGERSDRWPDRGAGASSAATKPANNDKDSDDEDDEAEDEEAGRGGSSSGVDSRKDGSVEYHPLDDSWTFWFDRRVTFRKSDKDKDKADKGAEKGYESNLKEVGRFNNVEYFWRYFHHMQKPSALDFNSNYHLFRTGIKPMWEDPENARGGKWLIRLSQRDRHHLNAIWQNIVLGLIGEVCDEIDDVCGAVLSRRRPGDRIAVWHRFNSDQDAIQRLGTKLKEILSDGITGLGSVQMEHSTHEEALKQATAPPKWQK